MVVPNTATTVVMYSAFQDMCGQMVFANTSVHGVCTTNAVPT